MPSWFDIDGQIDRHDAEDCHQLDLEAEDARDHAEEAANQHVLDTGDGKVDVRMKDDELYVLLHDALGQGIDVQIFRNRGIVSIVLVDSGSLFPMGPSAEIELDDLINAIHYLQKDV